MLLRKISGDEHNGKPASLYSDTAKIAISFAQITVAAPAWAIGLRVRPATQRSIRRGRVGRFSAGPALCATGSASTSPRQSFSKID